MYLIIVAAALLQSIWIKLENTGKVITAIDDMVLLAILMNLLWKTQCRGAMMSIFVAVIGIVALICFRKNLRCDYIVFDRRGVKLWPYQYS